MDFFSFIVGSDFSDGDDHYQPKYFLISSPKTFPLQDFVTACMHACMHARARARARVVCVCVCVQKNNVLSATKI